MVAKRGKKPTKNVKSLKAKTLTAAQSKRVKGGAGGGIWATSAKITAKI